MEAPAPSLPSQQAAKGNMNGVAASSSKQRHSREMPINSSFSSDFDALIPRPHKTDTSRRVTFSDLPPRTQGNLLGNRKLRMRDLTCIQELGTGGQASVYAVQVKKQRTRHPRRYDTVMALKAISFRGYRDEERNHPSKRRESLVCVRRSRELQYLANLPWNPFIASILDAYADPRNGYLLLEFAPNFTLAWRVAQAKRLPLPVAKWYYANIVLAIEFLHSHGIVHRDLKTENVLIGGDGYLMLTDFGHSLHVEVDGDWNGSVFGTPKYYSPEMCRIGTHFKTYESRFCVDWWSAAVILFEILTGTEVVATPSEYMTDVRQELELETQAIRVAKLGMPPDVVDFVEKSFKFEFAQRGCCRSVTMNGGLVNLELRMHPFMKDTRWNRIARRVDEAPFLPAIDSQPVRDWRTRKLPPQRRVPTLYLRGYSKRYLEDDTLIEYQKKVEKQRMQ